MIGIAVVTVCLISTPLHYVFNTLDCTLVRFTSTYRFKVLLKLVDYILMASTVCESHTLREFSLDIYVQVYCGISLYYTK